MKLGKILFGIWLLLLMPLLSRCGEEPAVEEERGNVPFVPRADKASILSGKNRLLFVWPNPPLQVVRVKMVWNNEADSLEYALTSHPDTLTIYINDLEEGTYNFEIFTYDVHNNNSGKVLLSALVFGEEYASGGYTRSVRDVTYTADHTLAIDWEVSDETSFIGTQVFYTHANGEENRVFFPRSESRGVIEDIARDNEGEIRYRTVFAPGFEVIDTLFSDFETVSYVNRYGTFDSLPGWKFRCKVMAESKTIKDHGGMLAFKKKMDEAIAKASKKFQVEGLNDAGDNQIHFYAIEILPFEGASTQYTTRQWYNDHSLDVMLVVNDNAASDDDSWGWRRSPYLTLGHDYAGLFGTNAVDALLHEFGHTRGMYDLYLGEVNANRNSISHQAYDAGKCIMNYPYGETEWSEFSRFIINESGPDRIAKPYWNYFPDEFRVNVTRRDGSAAEGASLRFFPVIQTSSGNRVRENDVVQYRVATNEEGIYSFNPPNPFAIDQVPNRNIYNFLVQITYTIEGEELIEYSWMPMSDALIAGGKNLPYELRVTLKN